MSAQPASTSAALLFLPAATRAPSPRRGRAGADLVILDLEDAVKPEDKESAREAAVEAVAGALADAGRDPRQWRRGREWHGHDVVAVMHSKVPTDRGAESAAVRTS